MNNLDQAMHVIMMCVKKRYSPTRIAECLADYGLLAEDLLDPSVFPDTGELEWSAVDGYVSLHNGDLTVFYDERDEETYATEPAPERGEIRITDTTQGRELAYNILAACDLKDTHDA